MKKYILLERGCRGEIEDVSYERSELGLVDFCNKIFEEKMEGMEMEEDYVDEFCGVSEIEEGIMEVCLGEEWSFEVCEIVS